MGNDERENNQTYLDYMSIAAEMTGEELLSCVRR